ncbi:four helix bundle protein [Candidatus Pacearchaeota archaeon]|nr:four helix bundle protein [Candidatus Pacearchaeota archaeon]
MRDYKNLEVWKIGRKVNKVVYKLTGKFAKGEIFALVNQMRRASISVISNIGEGCSRDSDKEFIYYLIISMGSVKELECQFYAALDVRYINETEFDEIMEELDKLGRKLGKYIKYLKVENDN